MNIKKYSLKTMCAALACTTVLSSMLAAYATNTTVYETPMDDSAGTGSSDSGWTTEENSFEDIKVTYQQSSSYAVTIPKTITLGTNKQAAYSVKVSGDIDANQRVYVAPVDGIADSENLDFPMKDLSGKKADVVATVTQNKTYWSSGDVANAYEETNNSVSAPDLTAGTWEGTFQVEIRLETEKAHEHNYVDGKCECGAIDPNHTHNYGEDGTCTICGETISYETAPATAYSNWNYTLDDTNDIITLNYYTGSETDVIVYENYPVENKTYTTRIAGNASGATASTPYMFNGGAQENCQNIETIIFAPNLDTSNVTNMSMMFNLCLSLKNLDVKNLDTSNVTDMSYMFGGSWTEPRSIQSLDLSGWDVSNVKSMRGMFRYCRLLSDLNLSGWNTGSATDMSYMFDDTDIQSLDLSHFNTSNVTNMSSMFNDCSALTSVNLSSFDTSKVTVMGSMFQGCRSLTSLDIRNFDTRNVGGMVSMFADCPNLRSIYVGSNWAVPTKEINKRNMFYNCGTSSVTSR